MYGTINLSIEEMIVDNYGEETWESVKKCSGTDVDFFLSNQSYDDSITFKLTTIASKKLNIPIDDLLFTFGEYAGRRKSAALHGINGNNLKELLLDLPNLHNRITLLYPHLQPPQFKVSDVEDNALHLHYFSHRVGLKTFVHGLLKGFLAKLFNQPIQIDIIESRDAGNEHEVFKISW
jgi:predicted hydrocarbon binding protein